MQLMEDELDIRRLEREASLRSRIKQLPNGGKNMKRDFQHEQITRKFIRETKLGKALPVYTESNTDLIVWEPKEAVLFDNWFKIIHKQSMYNDMKKKTEEIINSVILNNIDRDNVMTRLNGGY